MKNNLAFIAVFTIALLIGTTVLLYDSVQTLPLWVQNIASLLFCLTAYENAKTYDPKLVMFVVFLGFLTFLPNYFIPSTATLFIVAILFSVLYRLIGWLFVRVQG